MSTIKSPRAAPQCSVPECTEQAQTRKLCKAHGGGKRCRGPNCVKLAQSRGFCVSHGGGRRCSNINCSKLAQYKGLCLAHGGGRRCRVPNCQKFVQIRGCCKSHAKLMKTKSCQGTPGLQSGDCTSLEAFQANQPSLRSSDLTSYSSPGEYGSDTFYRSPVIDSTGPRIVKAPGYASPLEIQAAEIAEPTPSLVLYRPLCRRLYCQPRLLHGSN